MEELIIQMLMEELHGKHLQILKELMFMLYLILMDQVGTVITDILSVVV